MNLQGFKRKVGYALKKCKIVGDSQFLGHKIKASMSL